MDKRRRLSAREIADLKLIDELLCDLKQVAGLTWADLETYTSITRAAMVRLRGAWRLMPAITLGLAKHFEATS